MIESSGGSRSGRVLGWSWKAVAASSAIAAVLAVGPVAPTASAEACTQPTASACPSLAGAGTLAAYVYHSPVPYSMSRIFVVDWSASDAGGPGLLRSSMTWKWAPITGSTYTLSNASLAVSAPYTGGYRVNDGAPGWRYCYQATAMDVLGRTAVSAWRCTNVPLDDRYLTASTGWTRGSGSGWMSNTYSQATRYGASLSTPAVVNTWQIGVVATTCPTCGALAVYDAGVRVGTLSLVSATTVVQQLVLLPRFTVKHLGAIRLSVVTSGKLVKVDSFAVSYW